MSATDMITVGEPLPRIAAVEPGDGPLSVVVTWADGSRAGRSETIDLAPMILTFKVLRPLRDDDRLFRTVRLGEGGWSIVWDQHPDLDLGADSLEDLAEEAMTSADLAAFMERHGLSYDAAAAHLGISRRLLAYYLKERAIPRTVALACRYLDTALARSAA